MCAGKVPQRPCSPSTRTRRAQAPAPATAASSGTARARRRSRTRRGACRRTSTSPNSISCGARSTAREPEVRDLSDGEREDELRTRQLPAVRTCTVDCNGMQSHRVPIAAFRKDFIKCKTFNSLILQVISWICNVCLFNYRSLFFGRLKAKYIIIIIISIVLLMLWYDSYIIA